jgi:hypothetical protein
LHKFFIIVALSILFATAGAYSDEWCVYPDGSGQCPTIQSAVDSAVSGDWIVVQGGTYYEDNIVVDGKDLWFSPQGGNPVISAPTHGSGFGITFINVSMTCNLYAFTFMYFDTAIAIDGGSPAVWFSTIKNCNKGIAVSGSASAPDIGYSFVDSCTTACEIQQGSGVVIYNHTIVNCDTGILISGGNVTVNYNIIYGCTTGVECSGGSVDSDCNDLWSNSTDFSGCASGPNDLFVNPLFCLSAPSSPGPYYLDKDSPCWKENNPCGKNFGFFTSEPGCEGTPVKGSSWGEIKKLFE